MQYYSLNRRTPDVNFEKALFKGLAPDGSLYFPNKIPKFSQEELDKLKNNSLQQVGFKVLKKWIGDELETEVIKKIAKKALNFPIPLKKINNQYLLELFHGPTLAFKDIAARNLALLMSNMLGKSKGKANILVATSGDTGGAVAHGFSD